MAGITTITGSSVVHVLTQLNKGPNDVYDSVAVSCTGSSLTGLAKLITVSLVSKGYGTPTDVIMSLGSTAAHAQTQIAGSYNNTSSLHAVAVANMPISDLNGQTGSQGDVIIVGLVKNLGTY